MIYIEFIDRDRQTPMEIFRFYADQASWTDPADGLVGLFGRTMRLGPYPAYLAFWKCKGMTRMDEWEAYFRSQAYLEHQSERATLQAIHLVRGGCYDILVEGPAAAPESLICIEYFGAAAATPDSAIVAHMRTREAASGGATLNFVLRRIGRLGPDPGCLAVWSFADYEALEPFQRTDLDGDPFAPVETGIYRWFGRDIL